jgi:hypothetical protein
MSKLKWDEIGERLYETGLSNGVLYPRGVSGTYPKGVAWNGMTAVNESPGGAEPTDLYANNSKYMSLFSAETFGATIEAYTYPKEFAECDGTAEIAPGVYAGQQARKPFGFTYKTLIGNDVALDEYGYTIHIVYGATASPSEKANNTVNESPEAATFSWEVTTTPLKVDGLKKPTAHMFFKSTEIDEAKLKALEDILYGTDGDGTEGSTGTDARLPLPEEVIELFAES